jgi:uncharacterized lipoprotein YmbA
MRRIQVALAGVVILSVVACSLGTVLEPTRDPSQFFVLTPMDASVRGVPITYSGGGTSRALEIGLGQVKFPAYLARPAIVTRVSPNRLDFSSIDRWAEPLEKNFVSVLAQNLVTLLGAHVTTFPWYRPTNLDYQIALDITRFDTDSKGTARIVGRWEIKDPNTGDLLNSGNLDITEPAQAPENIAATLSRALGDLSTQLADGVRATPHPPPPAKAS